MKKLLWIREELLVLFTTRFESTADEVLTMQVRLQEVGTAGAQTSRNSQGQRYQPTIISAR